MINGSIGKAIEQAKTHKLSANKVFIGTILKKTREVTKKKIKDAGLGLIYLMPDDSVNVEIDVHDDNMPLNLIKNKLLNRIREIL